MTAAIKTILEADPKFNSDEAAQYLGLSPGTLPVWRCNGRHAIPFIRVGRAIRYRKSDLDRWLESRTVGASELTPA